MDPGNSLAYDFLGQVLWKINKPAEAFSAFERARTFEGVFSGEEIGEMRKAYEAFGLSAYLRKVNELRQQHLARGKYQSALIIALQYAAAGVDGDALDWLERAVHEHSTGYRN
jgi:hypothetical protein